MARSGGASSGLASSLSIAPFPDGIFNAFSIIIIGTRISSVRTFFAPCFATSVRCRRLSLFAAVRARSRHSLYPSRGSGIGLVLDSRPSVQFPHHARARLCHIMTDRPSDRPQQPIIRPTFFSLDDFHTACCRLEDAYLNLQLRHDHNFVLVRIGKVGHPRRGNAAHPALNSS